MKYYNSFLRARPTKGEYLTSQLFNFLNIFREESQCCDYFIARAWPRCRYLSEADDMGTNRTGTGVRVLDLNLGSDTYGCLTFLGYLTSELQFHHLQSRGY